MPGCGEPPGPGECSPASPSTATAPSAARSSATAGNFPGYTQLTAATKNGRHSFVVTANTQMEEQLDEELFDLFNEVNEAAICAVAPSQLARTVTMGNRCAMPMTAS